MTPSTAVGQGTRITVAPDEIAVGAFVVPVAHSSRGVMVRAKGTAEGYIAAADALLFEAFSCLDCDLGRRAPDGTPLRELHDRARDALRGLLAGLAS